MSRNVNRLPQAQGPMIFTIALVNSTLVMGVAGWFVAGPLSNEVTLGALELALIAGWLLAGIAGMAVAFAATRMRGWTMSAGRITPDGTGGAKGVDTSSTYLARAFPRFIIGGAMIEVGAAIGMIMIIALEQPEAGLALVALSALGTIKLMFPALQILRRGTALVALEAAALAAAGRG